ncbi:MAG TPA: PfkB family carbohydrate kinase, partial [Acidimicrobiia bacterium]|nr:PfkB family carbohydrate kinase [Acidimicrobiia bacterium]
MTSSLPALLSRFAHLDVVVVGDALLDVYLDGHATKLCREAPVPVVEVDERVDVPGGAGNVAMNLAALGATSTLVSLVGEDDAGAVLRRRLTEGGVDVSRLVVDDSRETVSLQRVTAGSQVLVRVDTGSEAPPA